VQNLIRLMCCLLSLSLLAEAAYYVPDTPRDMERVEFYLVTVGAGHEVSDRFGHTGIRVVDPVGKTDVVFNWGRYYFDSPLFLWRFFRGELIYSMGVRSFKADIAKYQSMERRVVMNALELDQGEKERLFKLIQKNARPENREFSYQYWYNNCATIPRDYIDQALSGAVRETLASHAATVTFRHYVRKHLAAIPFVAPFLDTIMNSNIDQPITLWEEMFLPEKLRTHLMTISRKDVSGKERMLLGQDVVLSAYPEVFTPRFVLRWSAMIPALLLVVFTLVQAWQRLLGVLCIVYGVGSGGLGILMVLNWLASGHSDTWHNANLWLFWPVDLTFAYFGWHWLRHKSVNPKRIPLVFTILGAHAFASVILILGVEMGWIQQDIGRVFQFGFLPWFGAVLGSVLVMHRGFRKTEQHLDHIKEHNACSHIY